jgi:5-methyltetrahydrofolate--homocysteine methyltransferase
MDTMLQTIFDNVIEGNKNEVETAVRDALAAGVPPEILLNTGLISAMEEVGKRFEMGEFYVPEMLIAARAMQSGLSCLKPSLIKSGIQAKGKVIMGTVQGDLHEIGKNLVATMLEGAGFEVIDLGTDVPAEKFIAAVKESQPNLIGMSALLTTTMQNMSKTIQALKEAGALDKVKVIVGGAPVTEKFSQEIGADGYAPDASRAVALAKRLIFK